MPNLNYAEQWTPELLEILMQETLTSPFVTTNVRWLDGKTFHFTQMSVSGYKNHKRSGGWNEGSFNQKDVPYTVTHDRDVSFLVDKADVMETNKTASIQNISRVFEQTQVAPETDALFFSKVAAAAKSVAGYHSETSAGSYTTGNVFSKLKGFLSAGKLRRYKAKGLLVIEQAAKKAAKANRLLGIDEINKAGNNSVVADTSGVGVAATDIQMLTNVTEPTKGLLGEVNTGLDALTKKVEPFTNALKRLWDGGLSKLGKFKVTGFKDFYESFLVPIGTWAFGTEDKGLSRLIDIINEDLCGVDWNTINTNLKNFWIAIEPYAENFGEGLIDFFEDAADAGFNISDKLFGKDGLLVDLTEWLNGNDPEVARDWGHALGRFAVALFLFKKLKPVFSILSNLIGLLGKLFGGNLFGKTQNMAEALFSLGKLKENRHSGYG